MRLDENLAALVKNEPKTRAAREAKKLGLRYMGFGRYGDKKGKIKFIVDQKRDMLVPYKSSDELHRMSNKLYDERDKVYSAEGPQKEKAKQKYADLENTLKSHQSNRGTLAREIRKGVFFSWKKEQQYTKALEKFYSPNLFDDKEQAAIVAYVENANIGMNKYLYNGYNPDEFRPDQIANIQELIRNLDSAFDETETPIPFTTYTGLSDRYDPKKFKEGQIYIFKGYVSTTLKSRYAIDEFSQAGDVGAKLFLQIDVPAGAKGIYVDPVANSNENEFVLPRGSQIRVLSGPHPIDSSIVDPWSMDDNAQGEQEYGVFFHCELVVEKEE